MDEILQTNSISNISSILKNLLDRFEGLSGSELAKRTGLPISTVNRILAGTVIDPRISTLRPLAEYFGITVDQLLGYTALPEKYLHIDANIEPSKAIPIYSLNNFWLNKSNPSNWFTWVTKNVDSKKEVFAISIDTNQYDPIFDQETILVVEPNLLPPQDSDYLLVKYDLDDSYTINKYIVHGKEHYLAPLNPQLNANNIKEKQHKILGVISEAHTRMRD